MHPEDNEFDLAPDAKELGDVTAPPELQDLVSDPNEIVPDEVDKDDTP